MDPKRLLEALQARPQQDDSLLNRIKLWQSETLPIASGHIEEGEQVKELNSVTIKGIIQEFAQTATKTGSKTRYEIIVTDLCTETPISEDAGRYAPGKILLNVYCEQEMNETELQAHKKKCDDEKLDAKDKKRDNKLIRKVDADHPFEIIVGMTLPITIFKEQIADRSGKLPVGTAVIVRGIRPKLKRKAAAVENGVGDIMYNASCEFSKMYRDPNPGSSVAIWAAMERHNHPVDFSVRNGYGPQNATDEDLKFLESTKGKTLDTLGEWRVKNSQLPPTERPFVKRKLIVLLPTPPTGIRPFQYVQKDLYRPGTYAWHDEWLIKSNDTPPKKTRVASLIISGRMETATQAPRTCKVRVKISSNQYALGEKINRFGIVQPDLWASIAPLLLPKIGGLLVCDCDLRSSAQMAENDPTMNPIENGKPTLGYDYAATYKASIVEPNLIIGVINAGFEITTTLAAELVNPLAQLAKSFNEENPLNKDLTFPILNLMESGVRLEPLFQTHRFFVIYEGRYSDIFAWRNRMAEKFAGAELIAEFSRAIMVDDPAYLGLARIDIKKPNSYCVFAISHEAYAAATTKPPEMTPEQFFAEVEALQKAEKGAKLEARTIHTAPVSTTEERVFT